jgi:hypothetical protein
MMRTLTILAVLGALGWAGYWAIGRSAVLSAVESGAEAARADGWAIAWSDLSVAGFPNRFDTEARDLSLRAPGGAWGIDAPAVEVLALSYQPNEVIVVPILPLTVATPAGPVSIDAEDLRASAATTLSTPPEPERATLVAERLTAQGAGLSATLAAGQVAMRRAADETRYAYDLALTLTDLALEGAATAIDSVAIDALAVLDGPTGGQPALAAVTLRRAEIVWNDVTAALEGTVTIGPSGLPEGELTLTARNWRDALPLFAAAGVPPAQVALLAGGISGLEEEDGRVAVPLSLSEGALRFGGLPLAPLPRLRPPYGP